ncbi:DUF992 domain-containing protein [Bradyrhizobium sp. JR3.5]
MGVGANVLFGVSNRTVALQPLSVEGQAGINVSPRGIRADASARTVMP